MTHDEKVALYVVGMLDYLKSQGFIEGGQYQCSKQGKRKYKSLKESGFRPTEQEIIDCMEAIYG